jgi:hypothetical protein
LKKKILNGAATAAAAAAEAAAETAFDFKPDAFSSDDLFTSSTVAGIRKTS